MRPAGWTPARSLRAGDTLAGAGGTLTVVSNEHEPHPAGVAVYNLEVEGKHTYFVMAENAAEAEAVWAHNRCGPDRKFDGPIHHIASDKDTRIRLCSRRCSHTLV